MGWILVSPQYTNNSTLDNMQNSLQQNFAGKGDARKHCVPRISCFLLNSGTDCILFLATILPNILGCRIPRPLRVVVCPLYLVLVLLRLLIFSLSEGFSCNSVSTYSIQDRVENDSLAAILLPDKLPCYFHARDIQSGALDSSRLRRCGCSNSCFPSYSKRRMHRQTGIEYLCNLCAREIYHITRVLLYFFSHLVVITTCVCLHYHSDLEFEYDHASKQFESSAGMKTRQNVIAKCIMHTYSITRRRFGE